MNNMIPFSQGCRTVLGIAGLIVAAAVHATPYHVSIDVSSLGAAGVGAAFDLVDGGTPSNSVAISGFTVDGPLIGPASTIGSVTGSLASTATLDDSAFFSEIYQPFTAAFTLTFDFEPTANGPNGGSLPDTFSFFLIDHLLTGLPLFDTTDPIGAGALFTFEIDGSEDGLLSVYSPTDTDVLVRWSVTPVTTVPEPASLALLGVGLAGAWLARRKNPLRA